MKRALSQRLSEGDGIAVIACVDDAEAARDAELQGAKALAVVRAIAGLRGATTLPVLWLAGGEPVDADAVCLRPDDEHPSELEAVVDVRYEDELERVLEARDPEILLLSCPEPDRGLDPLDAVLELLPAVPAGKLAIAHVEVNGRDEVLALERAGIDAVLVTGPAVGHLLY